MPHADYSALLAVARGEKSDYRLEPKPLDDSGGQGDVFKAIHKSTGLVVAFKRARSKLEDRIARLRREVEIGTRLAGHPHVVPVLDANLSSGWFVMPLAVGNAEAYRTSLKGNSDQLRRMVEQVADALVASHDLGWVHRDVKPANILRWDDGTWALGDWGLGRRPRGDTSTPNRTVVGRLYGTEGFAAPELSLDAHKATPAADIYSLGQVIGWALTSQMPQANLPLLPAAGPWRHIVKAATKHAHKQRPQDCHAFVSLMALELDDPPAPPASRGEKLLAEVKVGNQAALAELWQLAARNPEDEELFFDVLPQLTRDQVDQALRHQTAEASDIAQALGRLVGGDWGHRQFKQADSVISLAYYIARSAAAASNWDLLEEAMTAFCSWDEHWDQWTPQRYVRDWMRTLRNDSARVVSRVLREYPLSAVHFAELLDDRRVDERIRSAVRVANPD